MFRVINLLDRDYDDDDIENVIRTNRKDNRIQNRRSDYRRDDQFAEDGYDEADFA